MYKAILKNPLIRRLSLVQFIAYFGSWFSSVAIYTLILEFGVSPIVNALVVATFSLPAIILAPISGSVVDKLPLKKLMFGLLIVELVITLLYLIITDISDVWLLMIFIFIRMTAASLFFTAEMSLLPQVLSGKELKTANELHSIIWSVTFALGMALGGIATDIFGAHKVFLIDAFFFVIAIVFFYTIEIKVAIQKSHKLGVMIKDGFSYMKNNHIILHLILMHSVVALTSIDALINILTDMHYKYIIAIPLAIGLLNGTRALALMIGPFMIGKLVNSKNLHIFFMIEGLMFIVWAFIEHNFYLSLGGMFLIGFITTTLWSYTYTLIQEYTDHEYLGRVVAYNDMIFMIVSISTTMFIGFASKNDVPLQWITICIGIGFLLSSLYYLWFKRAYLETLKS